MIRNRNGYWMSSRFLGMSPGDVGESVGGEAGGDMSSGSGGGADSGADAGNAAGNEPDGGKNGDDAGKADAGNVEALNAKIARLEAEAAKQKAALDKATSEAGNLRKELRSKMTQEQIDAAEKQEAAEKAAKELDDLRKEVAKGKTVKTVMGKLGLDEESAGNLADLLYGAADIENALLEIQKSWQVREAALRKEFGKVTGPGAGADSNSPEAQAIRRAQEMGKQRNALNEQAQKALNAYIR